MRADDLMADLTARPLGEVTPSVYETGRLVSLAPWLTGHDQRVEYLVRSQRADGSWWAPAEFGLVPTLSATEALLRLLTSGGGGTAGGTAGSTAGSTAALADAVDQGLAAAYRRLSDRPAPLPDTPGVELILLSLIEQVNEYLAALPDSGVSGLDQWRGEARIPPPPGVDPGMLPAVRARVASGTGVPKKFLHMLEVAGDSARRAPTIRPSDTGSVGASPAATAAWLGGEGTGDMERSAMSYLTDTLAAHSGLAPCAYPITLFERSWVLSGLSRAGVPYSLPAGMAEELRGALGPDGTATGSGLPVDADTTSVVLYALELLGLEIDPEVLRGFELDDHFCTWPGEDGQSVTVNAHVLDVFGHYGASHPGSDHTATRDKLSRWLRERQDPDGSWSDRWHTSPYYATAGCAVALDHFGTETSGAGASVRAAVRWTLDTQQSDGSWGRWNGTAEETAYAMHTLLMTRSVSDHRWRGAVDLAVERGLDFLAERVANAEDLSGEPPLWVDKDLYLPGAIVRSAVLTAMHLAQVSAPLAAQRRAI
ncbi:Prenyltransferase and squalene oxidase repeat-containing protein [Sinosporangium album]|uniref:Prenyltransferase and squalene oxidase repeat-containing protein n=1 Tax=Sinosporangium album TaxID=504805 RepID=A0A1G8CN99_9ACTN|nr:prenyltransferase/squalene oxidase repeat-containing protein [Sinosporangium album]SDH46773.1 Prenyltransferase and squalene oxidase repeat-containing protein [Sinosporangium album]